MRSFLLLCVVFAFPTSARCQSRLPVGAPVIERGLRVWERAAGDRIRVHDILAENGFHEGRLVAFRGDTLFLEASGRDEPVAVNLEATMRIDQWGPGNLRGLGLIVGAAVGGIAGAILTKPAEPPEPQIVECSSFWGIGCGPNGESTAHTLPQPEASRRVGGFIVGAVVGGFLGWQIGRVQVREGWQRLNIVRPIVTQGPSGEVRVGFSLPRD